MPLPNTAPSGSDTALVESVVTTAGYTLELADASTMLSLDTPGAETLTIPTNAAVAFPVGTLIYLNNLGAGLWTIAAAAGVTLDSAYLKVQLAVQYAQATLWYRGEDVWQLEGNLA